MPAGGDIIEITLNHPDLGSFVFYPKSSEDSTYDLGGFRSDDSKDGIDASGEMIDKMNRVRPSFETTVAWSMGDRKELEVFTDAQESTKLGDWTFTNVNGTVYAMSGKPVGDLTGNGNSSVITLKVMGGNKLSII